MERDRNSPDLVSHRFVKAKSADLAQPSLDSSMSSDLPFLSYPSVDSFMQDYRSLDYACCGSHIGFQNRNDPSIIICSSFYHAMLNLGHKLKRHPGAECRDFGAEVKPIRDRESPRVKHCGSVSRGSILPCHSDADPGSSGHVSADPTGNQNEFTKSCGGRGGGMGKMVRFGVSSQANSLKVEGSNHEGNATSTQAVLVKFDENSGVSKTGNRESSVRHVSGGLVRGPADKVNKIWRVADLVPSSSFRNMAKCVISFMWNPSKLTVNAVDDINKLEKLQMEIARHCERASPLSRVPAIDDVIFAPYKGEFFRGAVVKVDEAEREVNVAFIDFGDSATVKIAECREPCGSIMKSYPKYGVTFTLNLNVPLPACLQLTDEITTLMDESLFYMDIQSDFDAKLGWRGSLLLDKEGSMSLNSVIEKLIINSRPISPVQEAAADQDQSPNSTLLPAADQSSNSTLLAATPGKVDDVDDVDVEMEVKPKPTTSVSETKEIKEERLPRTMFTDLKFSPNLFKISEATMRPNCVWKDGLISISSVEDEANMRQLTEAISNHVKTAPGMLRKPDVGEAVLAPYDGGYYRARITALNDGNVEVTFVDYGDDAVVRYADLKELNADIIKHPMYGLTFKPTAGVEDIESVAINFDEINQALESTQGTAEEESLLPPPPVSVSEAKISDTRKTIHNSKLTENLTNDAIVRINFVWNDSLVSISALEDEAAIDNLTDLIAKHAESGPRMSRKPDIGEIVIAPYGATRVYYRGSVTAVHGDRVHVLFVDFGDEIDVLYTDLLELNAEIAQHPIYGALFRMANVPQTDSDNQVSNNNAELGNALESAARIELLGKIEGGSVGELNGILWIEKGRSWNDIVLESLTI